MNSITSVKPGNSIQNYDDLMAERARLEALLKEKREKIKNDISSIKEEFKPAVKAFNMLEKLTHREDGKDEIVTAGTNLTIDLLASALFSRSNFLVRMFMPVLLKNLTSHYLPKASRPGHQQNGQTKKPVTTQAVKQPAINSASKKQAVEDPIATTV
jgi:hypothetical protein